MPAYSGNAAKKALSVCAYASACDTSSHEQRFCTSPPLEHVENPIGSDEPAGLSRYSMFAALFHAYGFACAPSSSTAK